jgi:serine/threonine-protein kinase
MSAALDRSGSLVGQTVAGKFAVEAYIGGGAMGEVYRAMHVDLGRTIALKVMRSDLEDETFIQRFQREAKAASLLDHPNTVRVLDFGTESSGLAYIAMEYLDGRDLYDVIKHEFPLSSPRIVDLLGQALSAMKAAHRLGIVHRDIKPENIMVVVVPDDEGGEPREVVKVCDFGIAKISDSRSPQTEPGRALTGTGTLMGTPEYMSPEQSRGEPLDARSDLYSMGVVLFQMLTGRVPFTSETPIGVVVKQVTDLPPHPAELRPDVDPRLAEICLRALEKRPDDRFQSAADMRAAIRGVIDPSQSHPLTSARMMAVPAASSSQASLASYARTSSSGVHALGASEPDIGTHPTLALPVPVPKIEAAKKRNSRWKAAVLVLIAALSVVTGILLVVVPRVLREGSPNGLGTASAATGSVATGTPVTKGTTTGDPEPIAYSGTKPTKVAPTAPVSSGKKAVPVASASGKPSASASAPPLPPPSTPGTTVTPPATAEPALVNTEQAFVRVGRVSTSTGAQGPVTTFMSKSTPSLSSCYRAALKATSSAKGGTVSISLSLDERGTVSSAVVIGAINSQLPDLPRCFQGVLQNRSVGPIDAPATADISLALVPSP